MSRGGAPRCSGTPTVQTSQGGRWTQSWFKTYSRLKVNVAADLQESLHDLAPLWGCLKRCTTPWDTFCSAQKRCWDSVNSKILEHKTLKLKPKCAPWLRQMVDTDNSENFSPFVNTNLSGWVCFSNILDSSSSCFWLWPEHYLWRILSPICSQREDLV